MFGDVYRNRRVLITGHTGFKGSWLALWLCRLGARVFGYSLPPPTEPNHFNLLDIHVDSVIDDIRSLGKLEEVFRQKQPEVVFHLAAQPIVRLSYSNPIETLTTNIIGTANVLEACRVNSTVRAMINITSDKCYENREWVWGYREIDPIGGYDPYSASKGCAELITSCWRNSFFYPEQHQEKHQVLLASCRAGNVIGGGDWAMDRLVPDIIKAVVHNKKVEIRNPYATRPWQHVLEPLSGYLLLGQRLLQRQKEFAGAWNFGPVEDENMTVHELVERLKEAWPTIEYEIATTSDHLHEAGRLRLDCSKSRIKLNWVPVWNSKTSVDKTINWYRSFHESKIVSSSENLEEYLADAADKGISWAID